MGEFARAFKVTFPDGFYVDGVQFPSGRCVLDDNVSGLIQAATSLEELPMVRDYPLSTVVWAVAAIEGPDSMLCDCPRDESTPTNPRTGAEMDHHCDCAAVRAAATMLRSYSATNHGQQCVHGTEMDYLYTERADHA